MQSSTNRDSTRKTNRAKGGGGNESNNSSVQKKRKGSKGLTNEVVHAPSRPGEDTPLHYSDYGKHKDHRDSDKFKLSWVRTESLDFGLLCVQTASWENTVYFKNGGSDEVMEYSHR